MMPPPMDHRWMRPRQAKPAPTVEPTGPTPTVPGQPTGLIGDSDSGLLWTAPESDGGSAITTYRVYADGIDVTSEGQLILEPGPGLGFCSLGAACVPPAWENDTQLGEYLWQVSAVNAVGEGPLSAGITYEMA